MNDEQNMNSVTDTDDGVDSSPSVVEVNIPHIEELSSIRTIVGLKQYIARYQFEMGDRLAELKAENEDIQSQINALKENKTAAVAVEYVTPAELDVFKESVRNNIHRGILVTLATIVALLMTAFAVAPIVLPVIFKWLGLLQ